MSSVLTHGSAELNSCAESLRPKLSVVVPVYNAATTLERCLSSVLAEHAIALEVVAVDDGSTDDSLELLNRLAAQDMRLRVIHQQNAGPSVARNTGLDAARGDILATLDADDEVLSSYSSRLIDMFDRTGADVVVFGASCEPPHVASRRIQMLLSPTDAVYQTFSPDLLFSAHAQPYAWRTAVTRAFDQRARVRFPQDVLLGEDVVYQFVTYAASACTVICSDKLYCYHMETQSITHSFDQEKKRVYKVDQHIKAIAGIFAEWKCRGFDSTFFADRMIAWALELVIFDLASLNETSQRMLAAKLIDIFEQAYGSSWMKLTKRGIQQKIAYALSCAPQAGLKLTSIDIVRFFISMRGVAGVVERLTRH